jgi:hypothetical protein
MYTRMGNETSRSVNYNEQNRVKLTDNLERYSNT